MPVSHIATINSYKATSKKYLLMRRKPNCEMDKRYLRIKEIIDNLKVKLTRAIKKMIRKSRMSRNLKREKEQLK